jgi:YgiT-type zinc finger domain-containing protein
MGKRLQDPKGKKVMDKVDRCDLCNGELKPGKTTLEVWRGEELVVIRDVSADVCQQCKEAYISADVSIQLDTFLAERHRFPPERYLAVPQYSVPKARRR